MILRISSRSNPKIKYVRKILDDKNLRKSTNQIVCEGLVMLKEALDNNVEIAYIFVSNIDILNKKTAEIISLRGIDLYEVDIQLIRSISSVMSPQGLVFLCNLNGFYSPKFGPLDSAIILDEIQDPGNLGTVLRTADALGINTVFCCNNTVDYRSPKVIRSTMGAVFRINIVEMDLQGAIDLCRLNGYRILCTDLNDGSRKIYDGCFENSVVIFGNEARGVSKASIENADSSICIPIGSESLNISVAAGIIMWEMRKCLDNLG